jgi:outer membrane protein OmpA-like peptidoglycan-associated protein
MPRRTRTQRTDRRRPIAGALILALGIAGCAAKRHAALDRVELSYAEAAADPRIATNAPVALYQAEQALRRAAEVWDADKDQVETAHLAYVAARRVEIAKAAAEQKLAEVEASRLAERRTKVLLEAREAELAALKARTTERGVVIPVDDVLFEFGSATLRPEAAAHLSKVTDLLRDYPERDLLVEGHTDDVGSDAFNLTLSERRATSVLIFFAQGGVSPRRMLARGYGETRPIASNATDEGRSQNRRVELVILHEGQTAQHAAQ